MKLLSLPLATLALFLSALSAQADILSNTHGFLGTNRKDMSAEQIANSGSAESPTYAPFSPGDSDLGVQLLLEPTPDRTPVHTSIGFDLHYTDNAPAEPNTSQESSYVLSTYLTANWQPPIAHGWFADIGLAQEFHEFDHGDALDFESSLVHVGLIKNFVALDDTLFYTRYELQRITTGDYSDSDYIAHRIRTGLQKTLFVTHRQQLNGGISAAFDLHAGPDSLERNEFAVDLTYSYALTHLLQLNLMARSAIWDFDDAGREDTVHVAGAELVYALTGNTSISTGVFYTSNDSNTLFTGSDSESWQGGLSLTLNHRF